MMVRHLVLHVSLQLRQLPLSLLLQMVSHLQIVLHLLKFLSEILSIHSVQPFVAALGLRLQINLECRLPDSSLRQLHL